eukprot:scaffold89951_cov48-Phaeocystis_antarctica.AAC.3
MADEPEAPPPEMERRPSALDKLKKAASLAAVVSTVRSSVDKGGPAAAASSRSSKPHQRHLKPQGRLERRSASGRATARVAGHARLALHAGGEGDVERSA